MAQRTVQVYQVIVETLRTRIASCEWQVGDRLPTIQQLAQEFGVGTGSVREAVRVLATEGVIRVDHGRGMFVTGLVPARPDPFQHFGDIATGSILAFLEARRILEPELAALAAERATEEDITTIDVLAGEMQHLVAAGADFVEPDVQFHRQIAAAAQNPVLARVMDGLNDLLRTARKLTSLRADTVQRAVQYHMLIAAAVRDRNPPQARLLMLAHVNDAIDTLLDLEQIEVERATGGASSARASSVLLSQRSLTPAR